MTNNPAQVLAIDDHATAMYAHLFQALSDPTRLAIVQHLATGEHRVRDLVEHMGLAQSTVSKHLSFLAQCGIVGHRPDGRATWYRLSEPDHIRHLITAAQSVLHASGNDVTLCDHLSGGLLP